MDSRSPTLLEWICNWTGRNKLIPLTELEWFSKGQGLQGRIWKNCDGKRFLKAVNNATYLLAPPPCIADIALEILQKSIHNRTHNSHVFVCPKLMTPWWRKILLQTCDFSLYVDVGPEYWKIDMHESLLIGVYLPLLPCFLWSLRRSISVLALERKLRQVSKTQARSQGSVLCQFLSFARRLSSMPEGLVRSVLHEGRIR